MIIYQKGSILGLSHDFWTHLQGSALPRASLSSIMSVGLYFLFQWVLTDQKEDRYEEIIHPYAVGFLASVTCFAVIFRSQSAIARYYEAARETHSMQSKLADATSMAVTFSTAAVCGSEDEDGPSKSAPHAEQPRKTGRHATIMVKSERRREHEAFCARIIHNVSLFTATAYLLLRYDEEPNYRSHEAGLIPPAREPLGHSEFRPHWNENFPRFFFNTFMFQYATAQNRQNYYASAKFPVIGEITERELELLARAVGPLAKAHLIMHWVTELITEYHLQGGFGEVHPPIVSRLYQEISNSMLGFSQAKRIAHIPFPFIYAQLTELLVVLLVVAIPLLMNGFVDNTVIGVIFTFLSCLGFCSLYEATRELEDPFLFEPNDLNMLTWQGEFNEMLILLTNYATGKTDFQQDKEKTVLSRKTVAARE